MESSARAVHNALPRAIKIITIHSKPQLPNPFVPCSQFCGAIANVNRFYAQLKAIAHRHTVPLKQAITEVLGSEIITMKSYITRVNPGSKTNMQSITVLLQAISNIVHVGCDSAPSSIQCGAYQMATWNILSKMIETPLSAVGSRLMHSIEIREAFAYDIPDGACSCFFQFC